MLFCAAGAAWLTLENIRARAHLPNLLGRAAHCAEEGNLGAAAAILYEAANARGPGSEDAQAALATLRIRNGQLGDAVWRLTGLLQNCPHQNSELRHSLQQLRAYAFAVAGDVAMAEQQCSASSWLRHPITPLRYLLLCKSRQFSDLPAMGATHGVCRRLSRKGAVLTNPGLGRHGERVIALLRAFARAHSSGTAPEWSDDPIDKLLEAARPTYANEFEYLQTHWPELRSFMTHHEGKLRVKVRLVPSIYNPHSRLPIAVCTVSDPRDASHLR